MISTSDVLQFEIHAAAAAPLYIRRNVDDVANVRCASLLELFVHAGKGVFEIQDTRITARQVANMSECIENCQKTTTES
jgi:hypothetical protein